MKNTRKFNFTINGREGEAEARDRNDLVMNLIELGGYDPSIDELQVDESDVRSFPVNAFMQIKTAALQVHLENLIRYYGLEDVEAVIKVMKGVLS